MHVCKGVTITTATLCVCQQCKYRKHMLGQVQQLRYTQVWCKRLWCCSNLVQLLFGDSTLYVLVYLQKLWLFVSMLTIICVNIPSICLSWTPFTISFLFWTMCWRVYRTMYCIVYIKACIIICTCKTTCIEQLVVVYLWQLKNQPQNVKLNRPHDMHRSGRSTCFFFQNEEMISCP